MPARKGLLAPQNTFLDTIATRFDGTRKFSFGFLQKNVAYITLAVCRVLVILKQSRMEYIWHLFLWRENCWNPWTGHNWKSFFSEACTAVARTIARKIQFQFARENLSNRFFSLCPVFTCRLQLCAGQRSSLRLSDCVLFRWICRAFGFFEGSNYAKR